MQGVKAAVVDHPEYNFIVTGHSLGGAAAVLATIEMRRMYGKKRVTMVSLEQHGGKTERRGDSLEDFTDFNLHSIPTDSLAPAMRYCHNTLRTRAKIIASLTHLTLYPSCLRRDRPLQQVSKQRTRIDLVLGRHTSNQDLMDRSNKFSTRSSSSSLPTLPILPLQSPFLLQPALSLTLALGVYKHLSPEYWISDGLGNKKDKIKVVEGLSSNEGNAGTGQMNFNIVAHIQYFQTNMYYCAMPFPLGIYGGAGSKRSIEGAEEDSITKRGVEGDMGEEGNERADVLPHVRVLDGKGVHGQVVSEKRELQKSSRWDAETKVEDLVAMGLGQGILTEYVDVGL